MLAAHDIWHSYGNDWVLSGIDLVAHPGDSIALMGPSGSGKTTLLSILGLLLSPTRGYVSIGGQSVIAGRQDNARIRSEMFGWVFQSMNAIGRRTALDNAALGLLASGWSRKDALEASHAALENVGLAEVQHFPAHKLSGGQLQRVCIARAVASHPRILLADEPTAQLDRRTSQQVLDALWASLTPMTVLIVATHDPSVASRCARVVQLVDGRVADD